MKQFTRLTLCAVLVSSAAWSTVITGVTIHSVSAELNDFGWDLRAIHLIDGSGLSGGVHGSCRENGTCWQNGYGGGLPSTVVFDLGASYDVTSMQVWNGYWGDFESTRSANSVDISTSADASVWNLEGTYVFDSAPASATSYGGFVRSGLQWANARYVRFSINSNYGGGSCGPCVTMNEVQFSADASQVPEPAAALLVSAGLAASLLVRRRKFLRH